MDAQARGPPPPRPASSPQEREGGPAKLVEAAAPSRAAHESSTSPCLRLASSAGREGGPPSDEKGSTAPRRQGGTARPDLAAVGSPRARTGRSKRGTDGCRRSGRCGWTRPPPARRRVTGGPVLLCARPALPAPGLAAGVEALKEAIRGLDVGVLVNNPSAARCSTPAGAPPLRSTPTGAPPPRHARLAPPLAKCIPGERRCIFASPLSSEAKYLTRLPSLLERKFTKHSA
jgi:hypothetical protein